MKKTMKKTMKKVLALLLASLMILLAMPFSLLTVGAEEATEIEITKFSAFGRHKLEVEGAETSYPDVAFYASYPAYAAFDGDIGTDAQTMNHNRDGNTLKPYEMCYFDENGVMVNGENPVAEGKSYYLMFIIKLEDYATVDTLSLWTPYVNDSNPENRPYMANNGYDIYYSLDGESYTAVDGASFTDVYAKQSTADALYVEGTYNGKDGHVHDIAMGGVEAGYIAIAVSDIVYGADEAIISEAVVTSTSVSVEEDSYLGIRSFKAFGRHVMVEGEGESAVTSNPKVAFYASYPAYAAFDGYITTDAQTLNNDAFGNLPYEMCYFDENGVMVNGVNPVAEGKSYYLMFIIELEDHATVDTLSLWTTYVNDSNPENRPYMANNGYDIYYSLDGESYTAVDGASFTDVYPKQSTADALYVEGTYNGNGGHVHDIAMGGVEARYIAIAVSDIVYDADEATVSEAVVMGEPLEHEFALVETVAPTCVDEGYDIYACACGEEKKDNITPAKAPATGHNYSEWVVTDATCTEDGYITKTCANCGDVVTESGEPFTGHNYGAWEVTKAATCTEEGAREKKCSCGDTITEAISVIAHKYGEWVVTKAATCTENGVKTKTCTVCNVDAKTEVIPAAHEYGEGTEIIKEPTCTEEGLLGTGKCIRCGETSENEPIPALGHAYDAGSVIKQPTCTEEGILETGTCERCGESAGTQPMPALGHDYGEWVETDPTCTEAGFKTKICSACDDVVTEAGAPATGHIISDWIVDYEPTATKPGYKHKECIRCGEIFETEEIPTLAKLVIESVEAGAGSTVSVSINVQNNPGIIGAVLTLDYDSALTLVGVEAGSAWSMLNFTKPAEFTTPCNLVWDGMNDADYSEGTIIVLTFVVPDDAEIGDFYDIGAYYTYGNMLNADLEAVEIEIENGGITVQPLWGDVNDDGIVDIADVIVLRRYLAGGYGVTINADAADMSRDGYITIADVVLLRRFLVA